jgi:hypothetical protein
LGMRDKDQRIIEAISWEVSGMMGGQ